MDSANTDWVRGSLRALLADLNAVVEAMSREEKIMCRAEIMASLQGTLVPEPTGWIN